MKTKIDHPGVYFPPPIIYVLVFFISIFIQKKIPLSGRFFESKAAFITGVILILTGLTIMAPALIKFFQTKNTLITVKPANSLQTSGIYSISRNPMYLGLLILYIGIGCFKGNVWSFMLVPVVILVITNFVIQNEEKYLERAFGVDYIEYRKKVRRWI
ncbi:MAG: isoprenylcysteine carboxylmethyltransferase family protein [Saprospirales bacterium]|nr:isoprenylcysteine carboxylmethyltransferase family protein [Saprospirales bacterium]